MSTRAAVRTAFAIAYSLSLLSIAFPAQSAQRAFVSTTGNDVNACTLTAPCRSLQAAVTAVAAGGEVIVLDSGGYGSVIVDKSVTIEAPSGVYAGVSVVFGGVGIDIVAGSSDIVTLRNLTITPMEMGAGLFGVLVYSVGTLNVEGLRISGFHALGFAGFWFSSGGTLTVANSVMEGNSYGIRISPPDGATATVVVHDTQLTGNDTGYSQDYPGTGITHATITRTNASANKFIGFLMSRTASDRMVLESCVASENGLAGVVQGSGVLVLSGNSITGNGTGVQITGGTAQTRGNNTIIQNGTDVDGTLVLIAGGGT